MLTDWHLTNSEESARAVRESLTEQRAAARRPADPDEVEAAVAERLDNSGKGSKGRGRGRGRGKGKGDDSSKDD